jgi:hypothetical protein
MAEQGTFGFADSSWLKQKRTQLHFREKHRAAEKKYRLLHKEEILIRDRKAKQKKLQNGQYSKYQVAKHRKRKFGIDQKQYDAMVLLQDNKCAICKQPEVAIRSGKLKSLAVDHCHRTGRIRGLLCQACNTMLGKSRDSIRILEAAIAYLSVK